VIALAQRGKPFVGPAASDDAVMPQRSRRVLVAYLLALGLLLLYIVLKLYTLDFPDAPFVLEAPAQSSVAEAATSEPKPTGAAPAPVLLYAFPQGTLGNVPGMEIALYGRNFHQESKVRLNRQRRGIKDGDSNLIRVVPEA